MKFILLILSLAVFCAYGYDPNALSNPNRHVCSFAIGNQIYNPAQFFNNNLRYRINEGLESVTVVVENEDGTTTNFVVDVAPLVRNAANMWNQHFIARHSPIRLTEVPQSPPSEVDFHISRANDAQQNIFNRESLQAVTTLVLPTEITSHYLDPDFDIPGTVISNTINFSREDFDSTINALNETYTAQHVAEIIVYYILAHEFGHSLGLTHPRSYSLGNRERRIPIDIANMENFLAIAITAELESDQPDARIPIMLDEKNEDEDENQNESYFSLLHAQLGRRVNEDDIMPSNLELNATENENACGGSPFLQSQNNLVSSESCKEKPRIFYPVAQAVIPIYQTLLLQ
ncbi:zinc metalloprotease [Xenorhabdus szentirmaii]|uniref:hypothetical protein n=1 Tax=Xenorhabdus szentirmaii TaxID=290112 RepID=UPI0019B5D0DE|nr:MULTISPECIES: hypothetical protein [unclassified Xenorhabdus]MBD2792447.1 hypothetical protein [Xenorhabdus sp. CUL]MBD2824916.1 hypothetical protein [Xenorhabdus sp. 5]